MAGNTDNLSLIDLPISVFVNNNWEKFRKLLNLTHSKCLFCLSKSPKPKSIQFIITENTKKQQMVSFEKLESVIIYHRCQFSDNLLFMLSFNV